MAWCVRDIRPRVPPHAHDVSRKRDGLFDKTYECMRHEGVIKTNSDEEDLHERLAARNDGAHQHHRSRC